jgi:hypothetical protein
MAGDWIKMRTDLYRDPKVSVMADLLMAPDSDLSMFVDQHCQRQMTVTRNVMRNVTVGALVAVWGVMRLRGKRENDDLIYRGVTSAVLDDIADLPGFGAAMVAVGWAIETDEGLVLPRFFEDQNVDPEDTAKKKNAERQARFREKNKAENNVTDNVNVTHREEKRREEPTHTPSASARVSMVLRKHSIDATPFHPSVIALAEQQIDLDTLEACCAEARKAKPNESLSVAYIVKKLNGWKADAASVDVRGAQQRPKPVTSWTLTPQAMSAKARELGISDARPGETEAQFKARIIEAINASEAA